MSGHTLQQPRSVPTWAVGYLNFAVLFSPAMYAG